MKMYIGSFLRCNSLGAVFAVRWCPHAIVNLASLSLSLFLSLPFSLSLSLSLSLFLSRPLSFSLFLCRYFQALDVNDQHVELHRLLAKVLHRLGKKDEADRLLTKARRLEQQQEND